jgi:predicted acyltransferase
MKTAEERIGCLAPKAGKASAPPPERVRIASIDAYRGFVMFLMMAEVLRLSAISEAFPSSKVWAFLAFHQSHVPFAGCSLHDLIQPSFSFLVGVVLPFSLSRRRAGGQSLWLCSAHAFWRALVLVLLGIFLRSTHSEHTHWTFEDTLSQIGLGYGFLYLTGLSSIRTQWLTFAGILAGYWSLFAFYPAPEPGLELAKLGISPDQAPSGFAAHWTLNANAAWRFDYWFLNIFPPNQWFAYNSGGYQTLSFIPTLGTMILGLIAGGIIRSEREPLAKVRWFALAGLAGLSSGWFLGAVGLCPVVKRLWTPSWVLFSGGWCFLFLAAFYWVIDIKNRQEWATWLKVIGANSIAAYLIAHLCVTFIKEGLVRHFGSAWFSFAGPAYERLILGSAILLVEWLFLFWMYKRKIFLRV